MSTESLEEFVYSFFRRRNLNIQKSAVQLLVSPQYLGNEPVDSASNYDNVRLFLEKVVNWHYRELQRELRLKTKPWRPPKLILETLEKRSITDTEVSKALADLRGKFPSSS